MPKGLKFMPKELKFLKCAKARKNFLLVTIKEWLTPVLV